MLVVKNSVPDWLTCEADRREWQKQDYLQAVATLFAGSNGCVTDEYVRNCIAGIGRMPECQRYDAFDLLHTIVINGHAHGIAADVLNEVARAWDMCVRGASSALDEHSLRLARMEVIHVS